MKIGFLGNTNNYPFMLARILRNKGHEILFIVDSSLPLHRPENRYDEISFPYPDWIYDVSPLHGFHCVLPTPKRAQIVRLLRSCDAVVLNYLGPSLLVDINRPAVVLLTGDDLHWWGNFKTIADLDTRIDRKPAFVWYRKYLYRKLIPAQRAGIRSAVAVSYYPKGLVPEGDALLDEIGVRDSQRIFLIMMADLDKIQPEPSPHHWPVRTLCATRLTWKRPRAFGTCEMDYKGSDVMIRGMGLFSRMTGTPLDIRLVKKGMHVAETIRLVEEEGLASQVTWLEEMGQMAVWAELKQADIIFEQFGQLSAVGLVGLDAMAIGRPVIANGRSEIMDHMLGVHSPICQAKTPEQVCAQLLRLVPDPAEREHVGRASRKYVEEYFSVDRAAQICLDRLA